MSEEIIEEINSAESIILKEHQVQTWRQSKFNPKEMEKIFKRKDLSAAKVKYLILANALLLRKKGVNLGETIYIIKTVRNPRTHRLVSLNKDILDCEETFGYFPMHIAGWNPDKKKFIIGRYFRFTKSVHHRVLPSILFIKTSEEILELERKRSDNAK